MSPKLRKKKLKTTYFSLLATSKVKKNSPDSLLVDRKKKKSILKLLIPSAESLAVLLQAAQRRILNNIKNFKWTYILSNLHLNKNIFLMKKIQARDMPCKFFAWFFFVLLNKEKEVLAEHISNLIIGCYNWYITWHLEMVTSFFPMDKSYKRNHTYSSCPSCMSVSFQGVVPLQNKQ